jgi:hypothetical protein
MLGQRNLLRKTCGSTGGAGVGQRLVVSLAQAHACRYVGFFHGSEDVGHAAGGSWCLCVEVCTEQCPKQYVLQLVPRLLCMPCLSV